MSWAASVERSLTRKNTARRKLGKRAFTGYNTKYVEKMRDYFEELYGIDPYSYEVDEPVYVEDDHPYSGLLEEE